MAYYKQADSSGIVVGVMDTQGVPINTKDYTFTEIDKATYNTLLTQLTTFYGITYDGNGATSGTAPVDSNTYTSSSTVTILGNTGSLAKTGYTFSGWNTAADGSGTAIAAGATVTISTDVTLYAVWKANT
jgi:uncharacterized repeat protein (TIGR02543 family)